MQVPADAEVDFMVQRSLMMAAGSPTLKRLSVSSLKFDTASLSGRTLSHIQLFRQST